MISANETKMPVTHNAPLLRDTMARSLQRELDSLKAEGLHRRLRQVDGPQGPRISVDGTEAIHFAGSDYLGLACHPRLKQAACQATMRYGCGVASARLISGNHDLYPQLEERLACFKQAEAALLFSTGYQANLGVLSALVGSQDVVFSDALNHASIVDGCRLSRAQVRIVPHNDLAALERLLERERSARRRLVVVDSLYSMDGDVAPLAQIVELAERYDCVTMVDDSHGTGVLGKTGRGAAEAAGVLGRIDIETGSLAKALGGFGGYVVASRTVIEYLINRARPFIFTCALPSAVVATVLEALAVMEDEPERRQRLWDNTRYMRIRLREIGFDVNPNGTQIIPLVAGEPERAMRFCQELLSRGVFAQGIRYPSVPRGTERIRLTVTASHNRADLDIALTALAEAGRAVQLI
ncbi:2-amino-3-ketobutyrate CoA ligase [Candidatus Methylomirabilis lanthanidiphila]|uniref:8-amino-7-oxononanoate synthase n=1 Tax=Candidatus Methylomirabilis lanthanidiphila TaxID=2211376 RepID=A0A564ZKF8_9BACT|nr:2-amino-3-ketobutyrate CoA ligase [Candidatus Methylomirabilis lanthanidiphila]